MVSYDSNVKSILPLFNTLLIEESMNFTKQQKTHVVTLSESGNEVRVYMNDEILQDHLKECGKEKNRVRLTIDLDGNLKGIREAA